MITSRKGGRPHKSKSERLRNIVNVRMNDIDYLILKDKAKQAGKSKPEVLRDLVRTGDIVGAVPPDLIRLARNMEGLCNNINQLARLANASKEFGRAKAQLETLLSPIARILNQIESLLP